MEIVLVPKGLPGKTLDFFDVGFSSGFQGLGKMCRIQGLGNTRTYHNLP